MSNIIKSYTVRLNEEKRKTIDTHIKRESDITAKRNSRLLTGNGEEGFVEGLQAMIVDPALSEEELAEKSVRIIEDARKEAQRILDKAKLDASRLQAETLASARKTGYEEGKNEAIQEYRKKLAELEAMKEKQSKEYKEQLAAMEPKIVELIASLVEKITGILARDRQDVIYYLVEKALFKLDKEEEIKIRVSREDFSYILSRKEDLVYSLGRDIKLTIEEDQALMRQQCLIETDLRIIDCSLDVQLTNLIADLKLLGNV